MHLVGREMDVVTAEDLGDNAPLGRHPPPTPQQSLQQVAHVVHPFGIDGARCPWTQPPSFVDHTPRTPTYLYRV
ncbi:hypothetical protein GCM10010361_40650 [Streptomyces olivaceiscleroticus]|uniref:Uncharacterized protein n=1 Tax=Streptomyces olivaceiscleroticus TaxID=68245 RepID=A0ABP3K884_9ACTN